VGVNQNTEMGEMKNLSLEYLEIQRQSICVLSGESGVPHHIARIGQGRNRKKPHWEHFTVVSLSIALHSELHTIGDKRFEAKYGINLWKTALLNLARYLFERFG